MGHGPACGLPLTAAPGALCPPNFPRRKHAHKTQEALGTFHGTCHECGLTAVLNPVKRGERTLWGRSARGERRAAFRLFRGRAPRGSPERPTSREWPEAGPGNALTLRGQGRAAPGCPAAPEPHRHRGPQMPALTPGVAHGASGRLEVLGPSEQGWGRGQHRAAQTGARPPKVCHSLSQARGQRASCLSPGQQGETVWWRPFSLVPSYHCRSVGRTRACSETHVQWPRPRWPSRSLSWGGRVPTGPDAQEVGVTSSTTERRKGRVLRVG